MVRRDADGTSIPPLDYLLTEWRLIGERYPGTVEVVQVLQSSSKSAGGGAFFMSFRGGGGELRRAAGSGDRTPASAVGRHRGKVCKRSSGGG